MDMKLPHKELNKKKYRFLISICAITLLFIVYVVFAGIALYRQDLKNSQNKLDLLASQLKEQTKSYFYNYSSLFLSISELESIKLKDSTALNAYFNRLNNRFKEFENIAAVDENGFFFASAQSFDFSNPPNVSKLFFFQNAKNGESVFIMEPHVGPISHQNVTGVVVRLEDPNQQFKGLLGASIKLFHLTNKWAKFAEDKNLKLFCFRENNEILFSEGIAESICKTFFSGASSTKSLKIDKKQYLFSNTHIEELNSNVVLLSEDHSSGLNKFVSTPINIAISMSFLSFISILIFMYRNEERYRQTMESSLDGFWINDIKGKFLQVNSAYCKMIGFSQEELLSMSISDVEALESYEKIEECIKKFIKSENTKFETKQKCKNGNIIDLEVSTTYTKKRRRMFFVFLRDITDRKEAENALRESEKRYRSLFNNNHSVMLIIDPDTGNIIDANPVALEYYGWSHDEITSKKISEINTLSKDEVLYEMKCAKDTNRQHFFFRHCLSNGDVRDVEVYSGPLQLYGKKLLYSIVHDITERKQFEEKQRQSERNFRQMTDAMQETLSVIDIDGTFLYANKKASQNMSGRKFGDVTGKNIRELLSKDQAELLIERYHSVYESNSPFNQEIEIKLSKGNTWFSNTLKPIDYGTPPNKAILSVSLDITERKSMETRLLQSQKMDALGMLAGGIAHDFNNILSVITGNVSYSLSELNQNDELFEVLSDIQEGTKQAQNLTQQLLIFAKGGEPIKKIADINQIIKESAQFVIRGANSRCEFELSENLSKVKVDVGQINQVISNLVINANQAMPRGGIIYIRTENIDIKPENNLTLSAGRYIKIVVEDHGIGISEKHLSNIFDPFFTTKQQGNGLGLSTVYSIVQKHQGHISVFSELEKGTVFRVYIPASHTELEKIEENVDVIHQGKGKILIMDDQKSILKMVGRMLNRMGYETVFATDGSQALEMYKEALSSENSFDMVMLDLTVPGGMGGLKTIIELLKIDPKVKAVVSSGYSNDPIMANYEDHGFCGVVPKPYTKAQLSEVLNKIFGDN